MSSEILQRAERGAHEHIRAAADVHAAYADVAVDLVAAANELLARVEASRAAWGATDAAEVENAAAADEVEREVVQVRRWVERLRAAAALTPGADQAARVLGRPGSKPIMSFRSAQEQSGTVMILVKAHGIDPVSLGLPPEYLDRGREAIERLDEARDARIGAESRVFELRLAAVACDQRVWDWLRYLQTARTAAMAVAARELPAWPEPPQPPGTHRKRR